jgi:hypothetical protein
MATWNVSIPTEDTKKFVDETSFLGFGLEFRKEFKPSTTVGILGSWEVFHQRTSGSIDIGSGTITGSQDRYINSFPIMLGLHRYFGTAGATRPYIGINAGGFVLIQTLRVGLSEIEDDTWEWGGPRKSASSCRSIAARRSFSTGATTSRSPARTWPATTRA